MSTTTDPRGGVDVPEPVVLNAGADAPVALPMGFPLSDAAFGRAGPDLVLTVPGHPPVVIRDFFAGDAHPALMTPDGARITGDLAARMAGPNAPGQVATAEFSAAGDAIGRVETVSGHAFVVRANGSREELFIGGRLHAGDVLETGADSAIGLILADETSMSMGSEGRMVLDEMIYDPNTQEGSMALSVMKGVYTIVSGMVSKTDPNAMVIDTPVGSIGIRGTQVGLEILDGRNLNIVMMREEDGYVGEVFIRNEAGLQVMNQPHQVVFIGGIEKPPMFMAPVDNAGVVRMFESTLLHLPKTFGRENDYSASDLRRSESLENFETDAGPAKPEAPVAPAETIRVVEGDYTKPREATTAGVQAPEASQPEPLPGKPAQTIVRVERADETVVAPPSVVTPPLNEAPLAFDLALKTREDEAIAGRLSAIDPDSDRLNFALTDDGAPKHGTVKINGDGTYTYAPDADFSGVDSFTYLVSDGRGGTTVATAMIEVAAICDAPALSVASAAGAEDTPIPLAIAASVPGNEEVASMIIGGVPTGASLSAGADNGDGTWTLAGADLDDLESLTLTPPADWSGDMTLSVTATSTDGGVATAGFGVSVAAVADVPVLTVSGAAGAEDTPIPLAIAASVTGNEELASITIGGVPTGAALSAGADNGDGTWTLAGADLNKLDSLTITPPLNSSADFSLQVTATSTDGGVVSASFGVSVAPVAEKPMLKVEDVTIGGGPAGDVTLKGGKGSDTLVGGAGNDVIEGGKGADVLYGDSAVIGAATVPIHVQVALADFDPSESLGITISGVPEGAALSAGTDLGDGSWSLAPTDLEGLQLTLPAGYREDFELHVTATVTDADEDGGAADTAVASGTFSVAFAGSDGGNDRLEGGEGDDILYGGGGDDVLEGGEGADVLHGGAGDDVLEGGEGADVLIGGAGNDVLEGGGGRDVLEGGAGDDVLKGGGGDDVFVFSSGAGNDIIEDYRKGEQLRFEGPEFSQANLSVTQNGGDVKIMFGGQDMEVTVNDVDLTRQGYSVTQEPDAVVITFNEDDGRR